MPHGTAMPTVCYSKTKTNNPIGGSPYSQPRAQSPVQLLFVWPNAGSMVATPYRELSFGWLPLACVPADIVSNLAGGHSELMRHLWHVLFSGDMNLCSGVEFRSSSTRFVFKGAPSAVLADEAALKQVYAVKGASGTLPCAACQNSKRASHSPLGPPIR